MVLKKSVTNNSLSFDTSLHQRTKQRYSLLTLIGYWMGPVLIIISHVGMLIALYTGLSLGSWVWIIFLYWLRMLGITAIYHRLLTHKAYSSPSLFKWIGSIVTASAGQMGPSWWKAHHEEHHRFADQIGDPHSPERGYSWAQYGWLLSRNFIPARLPPDIEQDAVLKAIDRFHFLPCLALALISYFIGGLEFLAAYFVSTILLFHGVALVNSICHISGSQPFVTNDNSRNNWIVALLTLGEGWHNCHHAFPWSAHQGITVVNDQVKYLPDFTYLFITYLQRIGVVSQLRFPSEDYVLSKVQPKESF
ncbi:MAG: acyl-CoA desaturase [Synechococcaceae cyanobacterium SM2_3_1]|nr:acyl-CoA desaturase [Synechococcaceae cyanobacterium SM2_3_1]